MLSCHLCPTPPGMCTFLPRYRLASDVFSRNFLSQGVYFLICQVIRKGGYFFSLDPLHKTLQGVGHRHFVAMPLSLLLCPVPGIWVVPGGGPLLSASAVPSPGTLAPRPRSPRHFLVLSSTLSPNRAGRGPPPPGALQGGTILIDEPERQGSKEGKGFAERLPCLGENSPPPPDNFPLIFNRSSNIGT